MINESKVCNSCFEQKKLHGFYQHKSMADGHLNICKVCRSAQVRYNYKRNAIYYNRYDASRAMTRRRADAREKWQIKNKKKVNCGVALSYAVKSGKILKPKKCESCRKAPKILHGHHDDYANPLDVRWLCPACHKRWHRENGEGLNPR